MDLLFIQHALKQKDKVIQPAYSLEMVTLCGPQNSQMPARVPPPGKFALNNSLSLRRDGTCECDGLSLI